MIWSISTFNAFHRCPRKWFYDEKVASRSNKEPFRRKVYLLSQLESIEAWRGKIVDYTISEFILPKIQRKNALDQAEIIEFARKLTRARYDFAKAETYKSESLKKTNHEYDFAALSEIEFELPEDTLIEKLKSAWNEIEVALNNFLKNEELISTLYNADYLVTQRSLTFKLHDFTIRGVPDLIIFYKDRAPQIVDWKVHYWGTKTYNDQLLVYALALKTCVPHKDFRDYKIDCPIEEILLSEYQLLKNTVRQYFISENEVERINDFIADGLYSMKRYGCDKEYKILDIDDFSQTANLNNCKTCVYKRLCQEN